jgi:hypothetical protein
LAAFKTSLLQGQGTEPLARINQRVSDILIYHVCIHVDYYSLLSFSFSLPIPPSLPPPPHTHTHTHQVTCFSWVLPLSIVRKMWMKEEL